MGFQRKFLESRQPGDYEKNIDALAAEGYTVILTVGSSMGDATASKAKQYPDIKFAIVVSQFTLYADTRKGHRPSFTDAAAPDLARPLCDRFAEDLRQEGVPTQTGEFGAYMQVELLNDGPVTLSMEM